MSFSDHNKGSDTWWHLSEESEGVKAEWVGECRKLNEWLSDDGEGVKICRRLTWERKVAKAEGVVMLALYQSRQKSLKLPELQAVNRITNIPIVETGWSYAGQIYNRIKHSNNLLNWTLDQAETSLYTVVDTASPAVFLIEGPLVTIDRILCKSLDLVEATVPSINLPPQMILFNTKQYVSDVGTKIVRPVLKRADSVKQMGNSVLTSKYTAFAADKLDGALDVADMYIDKYLPPEVFDNPGNDTTDSVGKSMDGPGVKAIQTSQHMYRVSKKLRRRLTKRTLMEAKALKEQSAEAIHVLVYVAELIATDPKLALQKGRELWASLSKDEPENQARPENLEQLIVLLTRETARRIVHLVNFTATGLGKVPFRMSRIVNSITSSCIQLLDTIIKTVHLDGVRNVIWTEARGHARSLTVMLKQLNIRTTDLLEQLAVLVSQQQQQQPQKPTPSNISITNSNSPIPLPAPSIVEQIAKIKVQKPQNSSSQDTLRPPAANRTQLKATNRHGNSVSNGESVVKS